MAAVTVASSQTGRSGRSRQIRAILTAPANADTWITGLASVENVQITMVAAAAADQASITSIVGGTITFTVAGTARDLHVVVRGK